MAQITKGATVHVFGIDTGTFASAVVTAINFAEEFANSTDILSEIGNVTESRMDDITLTGSVTLNYETTTFAETAMGGQFTYDSVIYYLTGRTKTLTNAGYAEWSYNFKTSEYITLS